MPRICCCLGGILGVGRGSARLATVEGAEELECVSFAARSGLKAWRNEQEAEAREHGYDVHIRVLVDSCMLQLLLRR